MRKIYGRNAVLETLKKDDREFIKLLIKEGSVGEKIRKIQDLAKNKGIRTEIIPAKNFNASYSMNSQGVMLFLGKRKYFPIMELIKYAEANDEKPFIVLLDRIQDVHNLGSIIRTAAALGVHGLVISKHRSAGITPEVERISQGNINKILICQTNNLLGEIKILKENNISILGLDMNGDMDIGDYKEGENGIGLILGNEGEGIRLGLLKECDHVLKIPMKNDVESMNVSVSFGVAAFVLKNR